MKNSLAVFSVPCPGEDCLPWAPVPDTVAGYWHDVTLGEVLGHGHQCWEPVWVTVAGRGTWSCTLGELLSSSIHTLTILERETTFSIPDRINVWWSQSVDTLSFCCKWDMFLRDGYLINFGFYFLLDGAYLDEQGFSVLQKFSVASWKKL